MKRAVDVSPAAEDDFVRLVDFLVDKNREAAWNAFEALTEAIASLGEFSERGAPGDRPGTRELFIPFGRAAYVIQYVVYERVVVIIRIFHSFEDRPPA